MVQPGDSQVLETGEESEGARTKRRKNGFSQTSNSWAQKTNHITIWLLFHHWLPRSMSLDQRRKRKGKKGTKLVSDASGSPLWLHNDAPCEFDKPSERRAIRAGDTSLVWDVFQRVWMHISILLLLQIRQCSWLDAGHVNSIFIFWWRQARYGNVSGGLGCFWNVSSSFEHWGLAAALCSVSHCFFF